MKEVLYILDQHAVDERIQVEALQEQVFGPHGLDRNVNARKVDFKWLLNKTELTYAENYQHYIENWGEEADDRDFELIGFRMEVDVSSQSRVRLDKTSSCSLWS